MTQFLNGWHGQAYSYARAFRDATLTGIGLPLPMPPIIQFTRRLIRHMPDIDFFAFFRFWLATIVTIYASIVTLQSFRNWSSWVAGDDKYASLLRRYLLVHGLRLRFKTFWGDVLICGLLCIAFFIIWYSQILLNHANQTIKEANEVTRNIHVHSTVKHS